MPCSHTLLPHVLWTVTVTAAITGSAAHGCHGVLTRSGAALRGTPACTGTPWLLLHGGYL